MEELVFAYYVTGHGLGHATRVVEVARHLVDAGHVVHIVTCAPDFVFKRDIPSPKLHVRKVLLDCGAVQSDALTVDRVASLEKYSETAVVPRESVLKTEANWLLEIKANLVVSDIVPVACRAAAEAGISSICVSNFSWDFIYADYVAAAGHHHRSIVWQIAEDYSHALLIVRLPGYCPMPAFRDLIDVPLVVREVRKTRQQVRKELGIGDDQKLLIFNFGGQLANWSLKAEFLPPGWLCLVCGAPPGDPSLPQNFIGPGRDAYTPDLIAASDCMLGKIGYGTVSEALAYKVPFVFVRRDYFNEEPFLRNMLEHYRCGVEMIRRDFLTGKWEPYLLRALQMKPYYDGSLDGGKAVAKILENAAIGKLTYRKETGARRLRDAIVFGYQIQRAPGSQSQVTIPEWYTQKEGQYGLLNVLHPGVPESMLDQQTSTFEDMCSGIEEFDILHGELHGLSDTALFLKSLAMLELDTKSSRERAAAAAIFSWEDDIYVARAPGRLDIMGGIADYSGSLVLQLPIREACHVAVQRNVPGKQRVWKQVAARQKRDIKPVIQIVSLGSELTNRAPTFDMDSSDFFDSAGAPISYEEARKYFSKDSSQRWAAYVAGTILVLIRELGFRFDDCISVLVSSAVPEGKGVSSSAALEVASMSALAAAYGLKIDSRHLAILCQKVENLVVGAPCGVMDQMTAACGEAYKLLAMVCQPAEVKEHVIIPTHVRFWGFDSGIKHSVGGADYGSVRVGAFMGRRIIAHSAEQKLAARPTQNNGYDELEETEADYLCDEKDLTYLCNLTPERFEAAYSDILPNSIQGQEFIRKYGSHKDTVTTISPQATYPVKAPTGHPVYENSRVEAFALILDSTGNRMKQLFNLGQLMYQSHLSYTKCGLGSKGTDILVQLVKNMQRNRASEDGGLYGAKISGGGCGGTVCVIGTNGAGSAKQIIEIRERYKEATGHLPFIFQGSSPGAGKFGYLKIRRRRRS